VVTGRKIPKVRLSGLGEIMPETSPRQSSDKIALKAYLPNLKLLYAMNSENEYFKNTRKELDE
jgi:hypothetical protein